MVKVEDLSVGTHDFGALSAFGVSALLHQFLRVGMEFVPQRQKKGVDQLRFHVCFV